MSKKRILIISTYFPPLNSIASLRPYSWAKYWTEWGHEVTVLTTEKIKQSDVGLNYLNEGWRMWEVPGPRFLHQLKTQYQSEDSQAFTSSNLFSHLVNRLKHYLKKLFEAIRRKKGILNSCRMPDFTDLWIRPALRKVYAEGEYFDVIVSTSGPYSVHVVAYYLKKKGMTSTWVADFRDYWSDSRQFPGIFPLNRLETWLERKLISRADYVTTVSEPFVEKFSQKYGKQKVHLIPNGYDPEENFEGSDKPVFPPDHKFRIVYTGSLWEKYQNPHPLFEAIKEISQDSKHKHRLKALEVVFAGSQLNHLADLIQNYHVSEWVSIKGFVSREKSLKMQQEAHALLFLPWNDPQVDGILTGKIFEYLHSGTPIIAVGAEKIEASQKLILEAESGKIFTQIADIKEYLLHNLSHIRKVKITPKEEILKQYQRRHLAEKMLSIF